MTFTMESLVFQILQEFSKEVNMYVDDVNSVDIIYLDFQRSSKKSFTKGFKKLEQ